MIERKKEKAGRKKENLDRERKKERKKERKRERKKREDNLE